MSSTILSDDCKKKGHTPIFNFRLFRRFAQILSIVIAASGIAHADDVVRPQPEISTGVTEKTSATGKDFMIVTANPYATKAGYDILKKGGSAADAAIAAQLVLGLTEPQSSGLGGGAFVLYYDAKEKQLHSYDARETAPNLAGPFLFQENGKPMAFMDAVIGGRSVGVPGVPMLLSDLHERHGSLTWMEVFDDAIELAEKGFEVSPRLAKMVEAEGDKLKQNLQTLNYFYPNGEIIKAGQTLKNPEYAETLKEYQFRNYSPFYRGKIAGEIIKTVQNFAPNPGLLSAYDFEQYRVKERPPVCGPYRAYIVCSMGEPSSGGLTLLQMLGMLEHFDISKNSAESWHIIAQASALAFTDRNTYMADPDFVNTPGMALIDPTYLKERAALIDTNAPLETIEPGLPPGWDGPLYEESADLSKPGTSHISVIDKDGNIVSMTTTIEGAFGSHLMTNGFLLNNQLTDFSFEPFDDDRALIANIAEPGKRPRSSMSPTIVFDATGNPVLVIGSAGGSRIIGYVLQRIISIVDWKMPIDDAIAASHVLARGNIIELEDDGFDEALNAKSNKVEVRDLNSGLTAIHIKNKTLQGAPDPRREGIAMGD